MGEHIVKGEFQSDKFPWCKPGFFPMKFTDKKSQPLLWKYAEIMDECGEGECSLDMKEMLRKAGYEPENRESS